MKLTGAALAKFSTRWDAFTAQYLEYYGILPLEAADGVVDVATWLPTVETCALDDVRLVCKRSPRLVTADERDILYAIQRIYGGGSHTSESLIAHLGSGGGAENANTAAEDLRSRANEAPVVQLVNLILLEAIEARASDVHLESSRHGLSVRYRIDGLLRTMSPPPADLGPAVISRIKIMADLDIAERRLPQDGRIRGNLGDREIDFRVATIPVMHGESVVLRILDRKQAVLSLSSLGMQDAAQRRFEDSLKQPSGLVLITGPTGSGKTTTLYAALAALRSGREKIVTIEDPVEYELDGICQTPVRQPIGFGFADALRAVLRQDPDVILVGEIRDAETAIIATQAALTGHLVLSTVHTTDAASAVTRLVDIGVPRFLIASTLSCVVAQRLVRKYCTHCSPQNDPARSATTGCSSCGGTGFRGRLGVFEVMTVDASARQCIHEGGLEEDLRMLARQTRAETLLDAGMRCAGAGLTSMQEITRVIGRS